MRVLGVDWAVHVHSVDTVGGLMDEFYGAQWLNPTSRPKFVHHSDAAQAALPASEAPGGALGLVFLDERMRDPIGALIFKLYIPRMFRQRLVLSNVPNSGPDSPVQALEVVPIFVLQQLAYVALDASELGPHLLERRGSKLKPYNTEHLKPFGTPQTPSLKLFRRFIAWSTHIDPSKGHRVLKVAAATTGPERTQRGRSRLWRTKRSRRRARGGGGGECGLRRSAAAASARARTNAGCTPPLPRHFVCVEKFTFPYLT